MDWYDLVLFAHILGVVGLFMALAVELASLLGARRARTVEAVRVWSSAIKPLAIVFPVTSLLILAAGLTMTLGTWGWGHAWIDLSLALLVLLSILAATINGAHAKRIAEQAAALGQGPIPPVLGHELNHPIHWMSVISIIMIALGIVFLMVEKPDWLGSAVTLVIALVVGVILAQVLVRSSQTHVSVQDDKLAEERQTRVSPREE